MIWTLLSLAQASPSYPGTLESELGMPCLPQCTVCHETNAGGGGTVTSAFGVALLDAGLAGGSQTDVLATTLGGLDSDSDGDGVLDVDELSAGDDPNGGPALCSGATVDPPQFGCFDQARAPVGALGVLAAAALARRRRR